MGLGTKTFKTGITLESLSADPSSPSEGQLQYANGSARTEGLYYYNGTGWTNVQSTVNASVVSKTTTYTATIADDVILCSTSGGAWSLTLYAASGNSGKKLTVVKTTSDVNALTIDGNASETIDGNTTIALNAQYMSVELVCDGSNWLVVNYANNNSVKNNGHPPTAILRHQVASGSNGGSTTTTTWVTRPLTHISGDETDVGVTLSSNQFTLPAGKYLIDAEQQLGIEGGGAYSTSRLRNITSGATTLKGIGVYSNNTGKVYVQSQVCDLVTLTASTTFELQAWTVAGIATTGLGVALSTGEVEIFAFIKITRIY